MLQKLTKSDYLVSAWSGGTTTQLAIFPPNANYADRDFLWRVSSATVDLEESDFTPLPDYDRLIATLEGEIVLTHNGGAPLSLRPLEVHAFSGADATHSRGRCRDFNLMLRRSRVTGSMEPLFLTEAPITVAAHSVRHPGSETLLLYCASGQCAVGAAIGRPPEAPAFRFPHAVGAAIGRPHEAPASRFPHAVGAAIGRPPEAETLRFPNAVGAAIGRPPEAETFRFPNAVGAAIGRPPEAETLSFPNAVGAAIGRPPEAETFRFCHSERSAGGAKESVSLAPGESLLLTAPDELTLAGPAVLMLCRMRLSEQNPEQSRSSGV